MLELLLVFGAGLLIGVVTGLIPGLHPNSIIFLLLPLYFVWEPPMMVFIAFVTGVSVVHTFVSFIPSIVLGAPEADTALSVLPGHKYLHHGRAPEAIDLSVYGGVTSSVLAIASLPVLFHIVPIIYEWLAAVMHYVLGGLLLFMVWRAPNRRTQMMTAAIIGISGVLGAIVLQSPAANVQYVLFPLFAGLFGVSTMLLSLSHDTDIPPQQNSFPVTLRDSRNGGVYGFVAGILAGFLPGMGPAQSALLVEETRPMHLRDLIVTLGGINTADLFLSIMALYVIGNPRSGTAVAIQQVSIDVTTQTILLVIGLAMIAVGFGGVVTPIIGRIVIDVIAHIPYRSLVYTVIGFIALGSYVLSGWFGVLVLGTATMTGLAASLNHVRRSHCMAALILPTILHYTGVTMLLF